MGNSEQKSLALLHYSLCLGLCSHDTVAVTSLTSYVAQNIHNQYGSKDYGKQTEGKYLYDDKAVRADSLVNSLAHGFVLVGLNILKQFACSSCQQNTYTLQPLIAVGYHYLLTVIGTLLLIAYLRKGISYAVSNV